ncbi:MAG: DUF971 domain-containing protein [Candidatus Neomarinimicrobiota bacterium]|nr:MAG: DUF971 domain-containing protein [Candidatus Neomarinimicrobiota bacterium]
MATEKITLSAWEVINDQLWLVWSDGQEGSITLKALREACPCANCAGESDVFGNIYKGISLPKTDASYRLVRLDRVGRYGLQPRWGDGHDAGIFTDEHLYALSVSTA